MEVEQRALISMPQAYCILVQLQRATRTHGGKALDSSCFCCEKQTGRGDTQTDVALSGSKSTGPKLTTAKVWSSMVSWRCRSLTQEGIQAPQGRHDPSKESDPYSIHVCTCAGTIAFADTQNTSMHLKTGKYRHECTQTHANIRTCPCTCNHM